MKALFLLLLSLLLCGCAAQEPLPDSVDTPAVLQSTEANTAAISCSVQKTADDGALQQFTLEQPVHGILPTGKNLILFSGTDSTLLLLLDIQAMQVTAAYETNIPLTPENESVQLLDNRLAYFDSHAMETVILDNTLREIRRIDAPAELSGTPLLSSDSSTVYYCTPSAIRALDVRSGISRILKESAYPVQGLSGLLLNDTVLQVSIADTDGSQRTLFLSADNGQLLQERTGSFTPAVSDTGFWVVLQDGSIQTALYGKHGSVPMMLHPLDAASSCYFLPETFRTAALNATGAILDLYDLENGARTASLSFPEGICPDSIIGTEDGSIWFPDSRDHTRLFRWDPAASPVSDSTCYSSLYYTREAPDYDGLAACSLYAQELSEKYGLDILVYKDAVALEPWDYRLDYEYQVPILQQELERLDTSLSHFPDGFLQTLKDKFTDLNICIVRSVEGSPESGSPEAVNGIQFMDGFDAYIVLAADHNTEYALYHELCHLMETVVLTESTAYDRWDNLNPADFQYDNSYTTNLTRDGSSWMKEGREYFIDTYSMSYAREDRARILEYAMTAGHETLFQSPHLQAKLKQLCTGIREAFGLENAEETFLWEQYLTGPLTPGK